ncbi:MAG TPA: DUF4330 family protein [Candidatus Omnitrophota bacterium]|nr:DUF4330 family protein [Candidatus Omnitrophota bacterium]
MRLLDVHGKVFGKINLIDLLVLLFVLVSIPVVLLKIQLNQLLAGEKKLRQGNVELTISVKFIQLTPVLNTGLTIGETEHNTSGAVIAEILWLGEAKPYKHSITLAQDFEKEIPDTNLLERRAKIKIQASLNGNYSYYKGSLIGFQNPIFFVFNRKTYTGIIIKEESLKESWIPVQVAFKKVPVAITEMLHRGYFEYDKTGKVTARLNSFLDEKPADFWSKLTENDTVTANDIDLAMELLCTEHDGKLYYRSKPLNPGSDILFTSNIHLRGTVIAFINEN